MRSFKTHFCDLITDISGEEFQCSLYKPYAGYSSSQHLPIISQRKLIKIGQNTIYKCFKRLVNVTGTGVSQFI